MFEIVQLSHDVLTDRVLIGIQGPTPTDYVSVSCSLPEHQGGLQQGVRVRAVEAASRLLAEAAEALRSRRLDDDPAGVTGSPRRKAAFFCASCNDENAG